MQQVTGSAVERTVGLDIGDRTSRYCVLSQDGTLLEEGQVAGAAPKEPPLSYVTDPYSSPGSGGLSGL